MLLDIVEAGVTPNHRTGFMLRLIHDFAVIRSIQLGHGNKGSPQRVGCVAGTKKPSKAKSAMEGMPGMENMADMPGMKASTPKQPSKSMPPMGNMKDMPGMGKGQAMPAMGTRPGMSMPANPMDKFRFEDNNPARNKAKNDKQ